MADLLRLSGYLPIFVALLRATLAFPPQKVIVMPRQPRLDLAGASQQDVGQRT